MLTKLQKIKYNCKYVGHGKIMWTKEPLHITITFLA